MNVTDIKKYLMSLDQSTIIGEVVELFRNFELVKDYYETKLNTESTSTIFEKYKDVITHEFFPKRGFGKARLKWTPSSRHYFKKFKMDSIHQRQPNRVALFWVYSQFLPD